MRNGFLLILGAAVSTLVALVDASFVGVLGGGEAHTASRNERSAARVRKVGAVAKEELVDFIVTLPFSQEKETSLKSFLKDLYDPSSPSYQQYVTPQEFRDRFCPTDDEVAQVAARLYEKNIEVIGTADNNMYLTVQGKAKHVNAAFKIGLTTYQKLEDGSFYRAPEETVLSDIPDGIMGVFGLDNRTFYSHNAIGARMVKAQDLATLEATTTPLTASKLRKVYNISSKYTGKGQTAAVVQFDNYNPKDIAYYFKFNNITTVQVKNVYINNACRRCCKVRNKQGVCKSKIYPCQCVKPPQPPGGNGSVEAVLDIEYMASVAPGLSKLFVYIAPNTGRGSVELYHRMAVDNKAKVISTSWGIWESYISMNTISSEVNAFMQLAAQGQTVFCASGDYGAFDDKGRTSALYPAVSPYVTGVGGTSLLNVSVQADYTRETTWWSQSTKYGGGGGISVFLDIPDYQKGRITEQSLGSASFRNVPDVALLADPRQPGFLIYYKKNWYRIGGTSASAPVWGAYAALVNEYRASIGKDVLGFVNPSLYSISQGSFYNNMFRDVKDGSTNGLYPAVTGYDLATGLGVPIGDALMLGLGGCPTGKNVTVLSGTVRCN